MRGEARLAKSGRGARGVLWLITGLAALSACDDSQEEATAPTDVVPAQPTIAPDGPAVLGAVTYGEPVEAAEPLLQRFLERVLATEAIDEAPARVDSVRVTSTRPGDWWWTWTDISSTPC